jgi:hypothetical protein
MISRPSFLWGFGTPPSCVTQTHTRFFDDSVFCFELGFLSEECLLIRGWASVPRIVFLGPAGPSSYSRPGFGPLNCLSRASSAFNLFEAGLRSLELSFSGQQCLQVIRGRASVPRIVFLGPTVPSSYSRLGFSPSNCLFRASSAFKLFEAGLRSLELSFTA